MIWAQVLGRWLPRRERVLTAIRKTSNERCSDSQQHQRANNLDGSFTITTKYRTKYRYQSVPGTAFLVDGQVLRLVSITDRMALAAGKHVLVEKPIATTVEDADAMIDAAHRFGRVLMVAEDMHFRPAISLVQQRIDAGDVGEPLHLLMPTGRIVLDVV